jgi:hypothetical protein
MIGDGTDPVLGNDWISKTEGHRVLFGPSADAAPGW